MIKEASLYEKINGKVKCSVCAHLCKISEGKKGICNTRENRGGKLYTLIYNSVSSMASDPIEKKPLYHFHPGTMVFSLASLSCNFRCAHCQNFGISFSDIKEGMTTEVTPEESIKLTKKHKCEGIAWTYNEPTIWFEYTYNGGKLAKHEGLYTVYVTNGYLSRESLKTIAPYLDAANVDVKAFTNDFYKKICGAELEPVLETCESMKKIGIHIELTYLIIPTQNDSEEEIKNFANWVAGSVGRDTPVHFSKFHPEHLTTVNYETPMETLEKAYNIAKAAGIEYVYIGNVYSDKYENTYCPDCNELLIKRVGYSVHRLMKGRKCPKCGKAINVVG